MSHFYVDTLISSDSDYGLITSLPIWPLNQSNCGILSDNDVDLYWSGAMKYDIVEWSVYPLQYMFELPNHLNWMGTHKCHDKKCLFSPTIPFSFPENFYFEQARVFSYCLIGNSSNCLVFFITMALMGHGTNVQQLISTLTCFWFLCYFWFLVCGSSLFLHHTWQKTC